MGAMLDWLKKIHFFRRCSRYLYLAILYLCISILGITFSTRTIANSSTTENMLPQELPAPPEEISQIETQTPEYVIIKPSDEVTFSSETTASIDNIYVKEGSKFSKDDILLVFDCRLQEADLNKALAQETEAKMASRSATKLKSYGAISEYELVKATSQEKMSNADVDKLRAIVDKCIIKAPFNGSVAEIMVNNHETVKPGDPLLKIVNTDNLEFEIQVPSCWLSWLRVDTDIKVRINETNTIISAKITKINPQIEPVSQSVKIIATIIPANSALLPGMSGQAIFPGNPAKDCKSGKH